MLRVETLDDRRALGIRAGADVAAELRRLLERQASVRAMFAAAPSQTETLEALVAAPGIDWNRVTAFHMDEYVGLRHGAPERFGAWLSRALFDRVPFGAVHVIDPGDDPDAEAARYGALVTEAPMDLVCLGIGVTAHLAFNDPPDADLADPAAVKLVELDLESRRQQVADECFAALDEVPTHALTVTIPPLVAGRRLFCMVPGALKARAVRATLREPVSAGTPSTVLRGHPACTLYLDAESAALLDPAERNAA
ncbi:glucosamine-6-phosphate deaminase [Pseudolysinimonas kribbensis]|uniref:Glucosamine-6-phosphate deaminase n=1 Tax=Pseudolysinimonas kribbensis TaxID=433641 RepID=A0ABQ6K5N6_9MICO|nr:6-phosphogluconolactonase [Pseudolysinimonas kribbensis]GMA94086.1 glucosamine-6-phosphate deaminase [Pseudolysinimonas kribbensis]